LILRHHPDTAAFKPPPYEYEYDRLPLDLILGDAAVRKALFSLTDITVIRDQWKPELETFKTASKAWYLYG
jgi:hypothetical protein